MVLDTHKGIYYPEIHAEAGVVTSTEAGGEICSHTRINPYLVQLRTLATSRNPNTTIRLAIDGGSYIIDSRTLARHDYNVAEILDIAAMRTMQMELVSDSGEGDITGQIYRYSARLTYPTLYEKVRHKMKLSAADEDLDARFDVSKRMNSGIMQLQDVVPPTEIREIAVRMTASANENPIVHRELHATHGNKVILLGITAEPAYSAETVYLRVDRDDQDELQRFDTYAFTADFEQELYIPALDSIKVQLRNTVAVSNHLIRFRYATAPLTLIEKLRWLPNWEYEINDSERELVDELGLDEIATVGVL
jgi:hypothetical protein